MCFFRILVSLEHTHKTQVRLSDEDVERERSIVVEEWRQGRGCMQRATEDFFKLVVKGRSARFPAVRVPPTRKVVIYSFGSVARRGCVDRIA